jgi:hypothetical protein
MTVWGCGDSDEHTNGQKQNYYCLHQFGWLAEEKVLL